MKKRHSRYKNDYAEFFKDYKSLRPPTKRWAFLYAEVPGRERVLSRQGQTFHRKVTKAACRHNSREAAGIVAAGRKKPPLAAFFGGSAAFFLLFVKYKK